MNGTTATTVQRYVDLACRQEGNALQETLIRAMEDNEVFAFGELLQLSSVQNLEDTALKRQLELLAYGNYMDYKVGMITHGNEHKLLYKLKQLSLIDIFGSNKRQTYDEIISKLDLPDDSDLENLFVSAKSASLITGKLDQRKREIYVDFVDGRDVSSRNLSSLIEEFTSWYVDQLYPHFPALGDACGGSWLAGGMPPTASYSLWMAT
eukprot:gb/GECG01014924.1/.p1 GENE.gb/GECG01014924.1/~~gb/GECG01014924.1/.p1  ORF type:complete len:208 (+),score=28.34 gb/GECG01014924.1/:1-624(+)